MNFDAIKDHLQAYTSHDQIVDAANYLISSMGLSHDNLESIALRDESSPNSLVLTTVGIVGGRQKVMIPKNLFDFDLNLVLNLLAHEMLHVKQKAVGNPIEDKNEREFLAYYEMLFHKEYPMIPDVTNFHKKEFGNKALIYFNRMGEGSELQQKYALEKKQIEQLIDNLPL